MVDEPGYIPCALQVGLRYTKIVDALLETILMYGGMLLLSCLLLSAVAAEVSVSNLAAMRIRLQGSVDQYNREGWQH